MSVASLELCKELYEVSGWQTENNYHDNFGTPVVLSASVNQDGTYYKAGICSAYDAGFLLRKLPRFTRLTTLSDGRWSCWKGNPIAITAKANNPENALCMLAIELFKQGVLRKEQTDA